MLFTKKLLGKKETMKQNKSFILRNIAGETILVPANETAQEFNGMMTMTETGAFIWKHIEETKSFFHLVDMLIDEYDIDRETASADISVFLMQLLEHGMIQPDNQSW